MKKRLVIRGNRVQDIGYRMFLLNLASEHGLTGFQARNVGRNAVEAVYEGDDEAVRAFESDVRELAPEGADVEGILFEDYDGPVMDIERFRSYFTTLQLGKMIEIGLGMLQRQELMLQKQDETLNELKAFRSESGRNQQLMIQKLDAISRKQDETLNELKELKTEIRAFREESRHRQELMLQKQDETLNELKGVRGDLKSILNERLAKLERDVVMIKERLGIE